MQSLKFDPGFGKKHGWIGVLFRFSSYVRTSLVIMNFDGSERAVGS